MGVLQSELFLNEAEQRLLVHLVLHVQRQGRPLATAQILDVVLTAHSECLLEELALHGVGIVDLLFHAHEHLLPETGHRTHTCGMGLAHTLLHFFRIGVDNEFGTLGETQNHPTALEDMGEGQEVHDAVFLAYRHTLVVGRKGGMVLPVGQHHSLRVARGTAGIKDIGQVLVVGLLVKTLHFRLAGQSLAQLQEVVEEDGVRVVGVDAHTAVEHDDALERRTEREDAVRLVVLLLLANEEEAYLCVTYNILHLLLTTRGIEGDGDSPDAKGTKIGIQVRNRILREYTDVLLYLDPQVQQCVRHHFHHLREFIP